VGSYLYEWLGDQWGMVGAYQIVVALSALICAGCWLFVPRLREELPQWWTRQSP
jgi:predicted MFS family arabinose efflux permease